MDFDFKAHLVKQAKAHCREHNITLGRLGYEVLNDRAFFDRLMAGSSFTVKTYDRFQDYFAKAKGKAVA